MICSVFQKGISFITVPIFTRMLTPEDFGLFNIFNSWSGIITVFATLNLSAGVFNNGMTKYPDKQIKYTSSMQGLSATITFVLFLLFLPFQNLVSSLIGLPIHLIYLMFINFLLLPALAFWSVRQRYNYKYKALVIITLTNSILVPLTGILAINLTEYKIEARIYTSILVALISSLFIYIYTYIKGKTFFNKEFWLFALKFNIPLIPHYLSSIVLSSSDRIMIEKIEGLDKAGIYGIAYSVSMIMTFVTGAINSSFIPWTYKEIKSIKYKRLFKTSKIIIILVFIIVTVAMLFAPEIILIMAPKEYYEAIWVIPPVTASILIMFISSLFSNIEFYFEKTKFVMIASTSGAVLNIVLNFLFIPIFGYMVAGYTTLICYLLFTIMHGIFMRKIVKDKNISEQIYDYKFIVKTIFAMFAVIGLSLILYNYLILRYIVILIIAIVLICLRNKFINIFKELKG